MQNYGVGAATAAAPAVKRRTDSYEAAQSHPHSPSSGENSRCESDDDYVNTRILRRRMELQSTPVVTVAPTTTTTLTTTQGHVEQPEFAGPTSSAASYNEERMRRKLQFFFMNPIEKWQARRKFPYKFVVQVKLSSYTHTYTNILCICSILHIFKSRICRAFNYHVIQFSIFKHNGGRIRSCVLFVVSVTHLGNNKNIDNYFVYYTLYTLVPNLINACL